VVDDESTTDASGRVDLDAGDPSADVAQQPGAETVICRPETMCNAMKEESMKARVQAEDLHNVASRWIPIAYGLNILGHAPRRPRQRG
jgi:hypothetical protein